MPHRAKIYVYSIIGIGAAAFLGGLYTWSCPDWRRFLAYLSLAMLAGALKVRLPRMPGTFSLGYLVVLMSIADLTFSQALVIGAVTTLVQCLWKSDPKPSAAQVLFNVGNVAICVTVCYTLTQSGLLNVLRDNLAAQLGLITCIYFALSTLLLSGIIAILNGEKVPAVWQGWFLW